MMMRMIRTLNVAVLACFVGMAGVSCVDDSAEGEQGDGNNGVNNGNTNNGGTNNGNTNNGGTNNGNTNNGNTNNGGTNNGGTNNGGTNNGGTNNGGTNNGGTNNGTGECDFNGVAGVRIQVDVAWDGGLAIKEGTGQLDIWFRADLDQDGNVIAVRGNPCEVVIPDFETNILAGNEPIGTTWPSGFWANPGIPPLNLTVNLASSDVGSQLTIPSGPLLLGASMNDELNDTWPDAWTGLTVVDHDGDGKPGVTSLAKSGNGYGLPRLDILNDQVRADKIYLAFRTILSLDGVVDSCQRASGAANFTMEQHAVGCHVSGGGECTDDQVNLLDNNLPSFRVTSSSFELQLLGDSATCDDVLAAL